MTAILGAILIAVAVLGLLGLAAKYAFGPVPAGYHAEILGRAGRAPDARLTMVLGALYRALAGALLAVALGLVALAWTGGWLAMLALAAMVLAVGLPSGLATWRVERATGVRTPWRAAAGLSALALLGAALSA